MSKRILFETIYLAFFLVMATSCSQEWEEEYAGQLLREGEVSLQWLPANMGIHYVKTRAADPKTALEQEIKNVHVFIFTTSGEYLTGGNNAFQGYRYLENSANLVLQTNMFENQADAATATIVAVANMPQNTFGEINAAGHPDNVENLSALNSFVFNLPPFTATLPESGLPMVGTVTNVNLSTNTQAQVTLIQMKSLMARIDLNFTMTPYQTSDDNRNPSLRFDEVRVGNFPTGGQIESQLNGEETTTSGVYLQSETTVNNIDDFIGHTIRINEPQTLTLYMFEHAREAKTYSYPSGIDEEEKQRYKNKRAADDAAYIELEGIYTNHNNYKYAVTYRIYPGANATDDFTIKANCQYKNNITVKGITVNNMGTEALLDTRVDIDSDENPYFIEMLRERNFDAHFNVTPMDVYIYHGGTVKVEIMEPENHTWIRMDPLKRAAKEAGDGKKKYFTTDLLQDLNDTENTSYTVTSTDANTTHEERIYFYVDENVPTEATNGQEIPSREATIRITYTEAQTGNTTPRSHTRDILFRQAGLLPVELPTLRGANSIIYTGYTFYIEYYEEYLDHYDGKDKYTHTYDGLPWGLEGIVTGLGGNDGNLYMPYGWRNTMQMMDKFRDQNTTNDDDITLNGTPRSAAEYCYNKNKRNEQGQVETCHWYLPTIRELEYAMDRYYTNFSEFQENWYWSSNPGAGKDDGYNINNPNNITWTGESKYYARATRTIYQWDEEHSKYDYTHATSEANKPFAKNNINPSGWDTWYNPDDYSHETWNNYPYIFDVEDDSSLPEGEGGFASRDKVFRIRAAYIYKAPRRIGGYEIPNIDNHDYINN